MELVVKMVRAHLPLLLAGCLDPVSAVCHDRRPPARPPLSNGFLLSPTVDHSQRRGAEGRASLLRGEASAMRPYWRKQGPDDFLHNGTVAMATDSTCTGLCACNCSLEVPEGEETQDKATALRIR